MAINPAFRKLIEKGRISAEMSFDEKVWAVTSRIPRGKVASYAWVAFQLRSGGFRAVGGALNRNPYGSGVPCHRVIGSDGSLGGFGKSLKTKESRLKREGIEIIGGKIDLDRFGV
jgi:methylated-DNA-[protein]-cysteine S-methyltransferase